MWPSSLNPRLKNWSGSRVWVVGASSGIGAALARKLIASGARVALSARHFDKLEQVAAKRPNALILPMDVTEPEAWQAGHAALSALWQGVDLVVFCAADYQPLRAWEIEAARARRTIEVNLTGVYFGLETILPAMLERHGGNIAIIASVAGYMGLPNATVYGPTKAALINLAELLYADLHPKGLGVYLINPGFVKTPLTAKNTFAMPALQSPDQAAERILAGLARGQFQIDFPRRFTMLIQLASWLPYRWRFALLNRALGL